MKHHDRHLGLAALLAGALAAGCGEDKLVGAGGAIAVYPLAAEFPLTYVGFSTTVEITVENTGRAPGDLRAQIDPPFSVTAPERVPGVSKVPLVVSFAPMAPGPADGTLSIDAGGKRFDVALAGSARSTPSCTAGACEVSYFDPGADACIAERAADGSGCSTHCVLYGTCIEGTCRGAADGCDDNDPCTRDLLASDCSCLHERYPDPPTGPKDDPCHRETCETGVGWKLEKASDGTVCGTVNECSGQFCTDGVCGPPADAPEGTLCGAGTPCRKPSRCKRTSGRMLCSPPDGNPSTTLTPVWRKSPVAGRKLYFEAVADDLYLYWVECDQAGCGLRSIVPRIETDGVGGIDPDPANYFYEAFDRFDKLDGALAPMFTGQVAQNGGLLLSRGRLYSTYRPGYLEAFDVENGDAVFRLPLSSDGEPVGRGGTAVNAHGEVVLLLADDAGVPRTLMAVSPTGVPSWVRPREGVVRGLVADENGNVYFSEEKETPRRSTLVSLDGAGEERFAVDASPRAPIAAFNGRILHGDGTLFDTIDGKTVGALPLLVPELALPPVLDLTAGWLAGYPVDEDGPDWTSFSLQQFIPTSAEATKALPLSRLSVPSDRSEPLLLDGGSILLAEGMAASSCSTSPKLTEWPRPRASRAPEWSCLLTPGSYGGPATVHSSLWIVHDDCRGTVSAFLLAVAGQPQPRLANEGWLGGGGEPGRGNRPLR